MRIRTVLALFPATLAAAATLVLAAGSVSAEAAFPGLNGKIVFEIDRKIHSINPDGTGRRQLTSIGTVIGNDFNPAWSPDGKKIALQSNRDNLHQIYVMNANGSGQTNVTKYPGQHESPAWSPDGQKIAFESDRNGSYGDIYVMNADGSGQTRLTNHAGNDDFSPAWSPNGQKIAFVRGDGIAVMNADGSGQTALTTNGPQRFSPAWSPDGQKIAFAARRAYEKVQIEVMNSDGSGVAEIPGAVGWTLDWQRLLSPPPPDEIAAFPQSATIELGTLRSGSAASLIADDNVYFEVNSKTTNKLTGASETSWYGSVPVANELTSLKLAYVGKNSRTCVQQLELRDFDTGSWVVVDRRSVGTKEVAITVDPSSGQTDAKLLRRFVSGSSGPGELHFRVRTGCDAAFVSSGELMQVVYGLP